MAKTSGFLSETRGKLNENFQTRQTPNGTILARSPRKANTPRRSEKQMFIRCQLGNMAANHQLYNDRLLQAFESKPTGVTVYNMMVQVNYNVKPVFITKLERLNGGCVVADYQFCRGSLTSIAIEKNASGVAVTDIALGNLVIGADTTVAQFANAVVTNNSGWEEYDQMTFFYAKQTRDTFSGVPRATMASWKVVLDKNDESPLLEHVSALGFTSIASNGANDQYVLGMSEALVNAGCAWVHSRQDKGGAIKVGSQRLFVENEMLEYYRSDAAKKAAYDSYGGINTRAVYLKPETTVAPTAPETVGEAQQSPTESPAPADSSSNGDPSQGGADDTDETAGEDQQSPTEPQQPGGNEGGDGGDDLDQG